MATQTRLPTGIGSQTTWVASSGGNKWEDVDDPIGTPDDDTTYISRSDSNGAQHFTFSAFTVPAGATISRLSTHARIKAQTGAGTYTPRIVVDGTNQNGSNSAFPGSYTTVQNDWLTNPGTGSAWSVDEVNGVGAAVELQQFGVATNAVGAGEQMRCTQVYAEVEYTEAVGGNRRRRLICGAAA